MLLLNPGQQTGILRLTVEEQEPECTATENAQRKRCGDENTQERENCFDPYLNRTFTPSFLKPSMMSCLRRGRLIAASLVSASLRATSTGFG